MHELVTIITEVSYI